MSRWLWLAGSGFMAGMNVAANNAIFAAAWGAMFGVWLMLVINEEATR